MHIDINYIGIFISKILESFNEFIIKGHQTFNVSWFEIVNDLSAYSNYGKYRRMNIVKNDVNLSLNWRFFTNNCFFDFYLTADVSLSPIKLYPYI